MATVDLSILTREGARVLIGHEKGLAARARLELDALDGVADEVTVVIPDHLRTLTPSFVQGLFAKSIHNLGEKGFFRHYKFRAAPSILNDIRAGVDRVLTSRHLGGFR